MGAELEQYILQTYNSKNSEGSMGLKPKPPNPPLWVRHALPIPLGREGTGEKERRREERIKGSISDIVTIRHEANHK